MAHEAPSPHHCLLVCLVKVLEECLLFAYGRTRKLVRNCDLLCSPNGWETLLRH